MKPLLVVRHVAWEGPHRILRAFRGHQIRDVCVLDGDRLPDTSHVRGAVFMGGPMSVNDTAAYPELGREREWLRRAIEEDLPVLGVCLGAQLLAVTLGAKVRPGPRRELGVGRIRVLDATDPIAGALAPDCEVLHWHGEVFDLPPGAVPLAESRLTPVQGFRYRRAWGLLFHAEADADLIEAWLSEPTMAAEAADTLGQGYADTLRAGAARLTPKRGDAAFAAFAAIT